MIKIHIAFLDNPFNRVSDQIEFINTIIDKSKIRLSISRKLKENSLNLIFENIQGETTKQIKAFCEKNHKKVSVILTEHIDYFNEQIKFHGTELNSKSDYMCPHTKKNRLLGLFSIKNHIRYFFTLGEYPLLENFDKIIPEPSVVRWGPPTITFQDSVKSLDYPTHDFFFGGQLTAYRKKILSELEEKKFKIIFNDKFVSRSKRNKMMAKAKVNLNIPQSFNWKYSSPMRIYSGFWNMRPTVSLNTFPMIEVDKLIKHFPWYNTFVCADNLHSFLATSQKYFQEISLKIKNIETLSPPGVPFKLLEIWRGIEGQV